MLSGSIVAIVTPMQDDGRLDFERFKSLIDFHIEQGTDGIVVVGTTGESPTVDVDEHKELIRLAIAHARGRITIVAGTGGKFHGRGHRAHSVAPKTPAPMPAFRSCLTTTSHAGGPLPALSHHRGKVDIAQMRVQRSGRTVADLASETTLPPCADPNIIGIKDATASIERARICCAARPRFHGYSGDDAAGSRHAPRRQRDHFGDRQRRSPLMHEHVLGWRIAR